MLLKYAHIFLNMLITTLTISYWYSAGWCVLLF